jgi:DNA polymerase-1
LRRGCGIEVRGFMWDPMLMHHLLNELPPHDLEFLSDLEFKTGDYSALVRAITGSGKKLRKTYDHVPDHVLHPYTATDSEGTYRLKQLYLERLKEKPALLKIYKEETAPISSVLREAEWHGNLIDKEKINTLLEEQKEKKEKCLGEILKITQNEDFNPGSPPQVVEALKTLGYEEKIRSRKNATGYSTDKEALEKLADGGCDLAKHLIENRKIIKLVSTYLQKALDEVDDDGRLRYSFLIHGTKSARLSASFLHQIPRMDPDRIDEGKANLRDIFVVEDDYVYYYSDYDQIELRILAIRANDVELKRVFADGEDVHRATAAGALKIPYDDVNDENRQLGKGINFGIVYGSEGYSLSKKNYFVDPNDGKRKKVTFEMVGKFLSGFKAKFKGVASYLEDVPLIAAANNGVVTNIFGRERHTSGLNDADPGRRGHAEREAVNNTIQSVAAEITIRTAVAVDKMLKEKRVSKDKVQFINTVHDSLAYKVHKDYLKWFDAAYKIIAQRPIPELENNSFPISVGIGRSWGEAEINSKVKN